MCVCVEIEKERESVKGRQMGVGGKLLAVGSGRRTVGWGWEAKGRWWRREGAAKERGRANARGRPKQRRAEAASWISGEGRLGEAVVRERVRETENFVKELFKEWEVKIIIIDRY